MSCYHPLEGFRTPTGVVFHEKSRFDIIGRIELPCGRCIGCRMRRAQDWATRVMHEASLWPDNCFVTLTYGRDQCPADFSLDHRDFQLFLKRVRKGLGKTVRYYMCGEYGPKHQRPHYHACIFNEGFREDRKPAGKSASGALFYSSSALSRFWPHGFATVQDLTPETASYCARYIMKKALGENSESAYETVDIDGVIVKRKPEYAAMSLKPGIGAGWYEKYFGDVVRGDYVVVDGVKQRPPKFYDRIFRRSKDVRMDHIEFARYKRAMESSADNTPERRAVREKVHLAKVSTLNRSVE